jgi:TolB-like protein
MRATALTLLALAAIICPGHAAEAATKSGKEVRKTHVVVFDFICNNGDHGRKLSDSIRQRLARHEEFSVVDHLTTRDHAKPKSVDADRKPIVSLMKDKLLVTVGIYGTVSVSGRAVIAQVACIDFTDPARLADWTDTFSDSTQRARGLIAMKIVEKLTGQAEWTPPEYGDEDEPAKFGKPVNVNGSFDKGRLGWDPPDLAATFIVDGPKGRGKVLKVLTTVNRDQWIAYRRKLRTGRIKPTKDHGVTYKGGSVAALEGVHYRSGWIDAKAGQRYWLTADKKGSAAKVFIKGFLDWSGQASGLPESSLATLGLTPEEFAELPRKKQQALIRTDARTHPERYRRECYSWYLNCGSSGSWKHFAAPFPPRGGLPARVRWIQIQIYSYWPPGEYLWDNVHLYKDPRQTAPLPAVNARTKNYKTITTTRPAAKPRK